MGQLMNWWQKCPERLATEQRIMSQKFPQLKLGEASADKKVNSRTVVKKGQKYWFGGLTTRSGNKYTVLIVYPVHYPGQEIKAYIIKPIISSPNYIHVYGDGHLCLYSNDHGGRGQGFGKGMTAVSYVGWTAAWLHAYEIFLKTGKWPMNNFISR